VTTKTLYEKIWDAHVVAQEPECPALLYIDLHLIHDASSPPAFIGLRERGFRIRRPNRTVAAVDHLIPTHDRSLPIADREAEAKINALAENAREFGIRYFDEKSGRQGIVHVIGPELGLTQPGFTIVCGDSHTSTHGAFGALAFGIGVTEVEHVLATQCLLQHRMKTFEIRVEGQLPQGCTSKDIILAILGQVGVKGGTGHVFEYTGSCIRSLSMEERMTICNMSIEGGARAGLVAPDDTTFQYLAGREYSPQGKEWDRALERWKQFSTDPGATFDRSVTLNVGTLTPMITYGTNPGMVIPITGHVPDLTMESSTEERSNLTRALQYMDLRPGQPILGQKIDIVFIGSCTNARISDLRLASNLLKGRKVKQRTVVVAGSALVKKEAEAEGIDQIFKNAGCEWREPGCSMCLALNGDVVPPGHYCVSTSNRNFEGRQGIGARTFLASPLTAAASALTGSVEDPRKWIQ
jgi:3-isopropylmalate/(R)-2-methylmalate dehydratase large subunit